MNAPRSDVPETGAYTAAGATVTITPTRSLPLAGFASGERRSTGVRDELEANVLVLGAGTAQPVALISIDTLYAGDLCDLVADRLKEQPGLSIVFAASHTHYAPATDSSLPALGRVDQAWLGRTAEAIGDAVAAALHGTQHRCPSVAHTVGTAPIGMVRRRFGVKPLRRPPFIYAGVTNAPNRRAEPISRIDVVTIGEQHDPLAIIWSVGCHPSAAPWGTAVTADFVGRVRAHIRKEFGPVPVLFLQGGAGDVRPSVAVPEGIDRWMREMRSVVRGYPPWRTPTEQQWGQWADRIGSAVCRVAFTGPASGLSASHRSASAPLSSLRNRRGQVVALSVDRIRLSDHVALTGVNAELMHSHPAALQQAMGVDDIVFGYSGQVFGYLPRTSMVASGGYEVDGHHVPFEMDGELPSDPDEVLRSISRRVV